MGLKGHGPIEAADSQLLGLRDELDLERADGATGT
jgi:hypothetical protein